MHVAQMGPRDRSRPFHYFIFTSFSTPQKLCDEITFFFTRNTFFKALSYDIPGFSQGPVSCS